MKRMRANTAEGVELEGRTPRGALVPSTGAVTPKDTNWESLASKAHMYNIVRVQGWLLVLVIQSIPSCLVGGTS